MLTDAELELFIQTIYEYYGYDFSGYSRASFRRRVERLMKLNVKGGFSELLTRIRLEPEYFESAVAELTVNVTEMFRDPAFFKVLREQILPSLDAKPLIRIWHAGCSTGEEVFSVAILLKELGLLNKSLLYATDLSPDVLQIAKKGIYPQRFMNDYAANYRESGGKDDFSKFYSANYGLAKFSDEFLRRMVFSHHNLVSDRSFNEFDLILCRNVLIYFDKDLQNQVIELFDSSLSQLGYLALGSKESLKFSSPSKKYEQLDGEKIWRKMR
jgi:chemotaxis protein methyltransferase CheR